MKGTNQQHPQKKQVNPAQLNRNRPEIRDDLDSREGLEQETKGTDITHNKKETHTPSKSGKQGGKR